MKQHAHNMQHKQQAYVMSDSNFVWFIDDYMKLESYSIEIYADIDAYSCYIIWIYVEITTHIIINMLTQFLDIVQNVQLQSWIIQSDQDLKTFLLTEAHHKLIRVYDSDIFLEDCYFYNTSVKNQRIEIWWRQLMKKQLFK